MYSVEADEEMMNKNIFSSHPAKFLFENNGIKDQVKKKYNVV